MRLITVTLCLFITLYSIANNVVVLDSITGEPMPNVSVFNKNGTIIGVTEKDGRLPWTSTTSYPLTLRCLGYRDALNIMPTDSLILLAEERYEMPEIVIESSKPKVLHILALLRDYSTLCTYSDTVTLFREKWIDLMVPAKDTRRYKGWETPRTIIGKSYYQFKNNEGLDSVSDRFNQHFSWSDWIGGTKTLIIPKKLVSEPVSADTIFGKYSPAQIWSRNNDIVRLQIDLLADTSSQSLVPDISMFFKKNDVDFEKFKLTYEFGDVNAETIDALNLARVNATLESKGRGHNMFMFNKVDEPFFVTTYVEIFYVDKEFMSVKNAKKWESHSYSKMKIDQFNVPSIVPKLSHDVLALIDRVNNVNHDKVRLQIPPDERMIRIDRTPKTTKERIIKRFRNLFNI